MSSKADYLKKYLSRGGKSRPKKKKGSVRKANLAIHDDDVDWSSIAPRMEDCELEEDDPDAAPVVASFKDESVRKWMPVETFDTVKNRIPGTKEPLEMSTEASVHYHSSPESDLDPIRINTEDHRHTAYVALQDSHQESDSDLSPPRCIADTREDLSPPREKKNALVRQPTSPNVISGSKQKQLVNGSPPLKRSRHDSVSPPGTPKLVSQHFHSGPHRKEYPHSNQEENNAVPGSISEASNHNYLGERTSKSSTIKENEHGRYAETVYRDKYGKKIDSKLEKIKKREEERKKDESNEVFMEWGRGIAQTKSAHEKITDDIYEMSKPLARYADDDDLEKMLKEREREGDPMLAFLKKKSENSQKGSAKVKMKPTYRGSAPPNRFDIRPGYRWDGVSRSNGFEKTWFQRQSNQRAVADEAYKWSVEDM